MKMLHKIAVLVVLLLMEAIIMLYLVPKANEDEINMRIRVVGDFVLALPIFQIVFGYAIFKQSHNITSLLVCCSNLLFATIWANQMWGFLWFKNISNDLETVAIASLYAISGALIVLAISSIMIMKFSPKLFASDETDR